MHSNKTSNMSSPKRSTQFLQWLIGIMLALGLWDLIYAFTGDTARYGNLYPAAHVLLNIIGFMALSFIWYKEQWAVWLFMAVVVLQIGLDVFVGAFYSLKLLLFLPVLFFALILRKDTIL